MFPGAGHPTRRWPLSSFVALAEKLTRDQGAQNIVFVGPEEESFVDEIHQKFSDSTIVASLSNISRLSSVLARLDVFVSSSTGPMHMAAAVGTPVVVLYSRLVPDSFTPVGDSHQIVFSESVVTISVDDVYNAIVEVLENKKPARALQQK
jgi:ADP-heptose:LPS heptosyltransferase